MKARLPRPLVGAHCSEHGLGHGLGGILAALPTEALRAYAEEYGGFVRSIAAGQHAASVQIERRHADLWTGFALSLGTAVQDAPNVPEVVELLRVTQAAVTTPAGAIGALYAFESQRSANVASPLEHELASLPPAEREIAAQSCEAVATALWNALSGLTPPRSMN